MTVEKALEILKVAADSMGFGLRAECNEALSFIKAKLVEKPALSITHGEDGYWLRIDTPGGKHSGIHLDSGGTIVDATLREVAIELGVEAKLVETGELSAEDERALGDIMSNDLFTRHNGREYLRRRLSEKPAPPAVSPERPNNDEHCFYIGTCLFQKPGQKQPAKTVSAAWVTLLGFHLVANDWGPVVKMLREKGIIVADPEKADKSTKED